jgi:iron(III) transport system permease protein
MTPSPRSASGVLAWTGRGRHDAGVWATFGVVVVLLAVFVLYPTLRVLWYPGLAGYLTVPDNPRWLVAMRNSLVMMVLSTASSVAVGFLFALAVSRADFPGRRVFQNLMVLSLFAPPFMVAFSYILMFGRNGLITRSLFGLDVNLFGWHGLWLVQTVAFFPFAALIIQGVLEAISPNLEYAGRDLGASEWQVLRTVVIPLARPGVAGAALFVAISVLADFGNAVLIAGNFPLLATEAWFRIEGWADLAGAAVVVSLLLLPTVGLFLAERTWVGLRAYTTVTGRGGRIARPPTPGWLKWPLFGFASATVLMVGLVYLGVVAGAFTKTWGYDWRLTLEHWDLIRDRGDHLWNSLKIGAASALLTAVVASLAAFLTSRRELPGRRILDFVAVLPAALPGVFVGVGFLLAFGGPPLPLVGTPWIVVLALAFWHLPMGYQAAVAGLSQIERSIEEAATNLGASGLRTLWDVYVPLLRHAVLTSFVTAFIRAVTNLSIVVFLVTPGQLLATFSILAMINNGFWGAAAAMTVALLAMTMALVGLARLVIGRGLRPVPLG